jgi:hypothetical protein
VSQLQQKHFTPRLGMVPPTLYTKVKPRAFSVVAYTSVGNTTPAVISLLVVRPASR